MIHFINENNLLKNRRFPLPKGIREHLESVRDSYTGDKNAQGWKRLNNILSMNGIAYSEMKRIKNYFDNYQGTKDNVEYLLNGGAEMATWVDNTLATATAAIKDFKQAKKDAGIENAFIRHHSKNRQTKPKESPTIGKVQSNRLSDKLSNNAGVKYESYESKTIVITESQQEAISELYGNPQQDNTSLFIHK